MAKVIIFRPILPGMDSAAAVGMDRAAAIESEIGNISDQEYMCHVLNLLILPSANFRAGHMAISNG